MKKFKLVTLLGIRPDYIRMFKLIKLLDAHGGGLEHILVHSGQHYDTELFGTFLKEFSIRKPDIDLGVGLTLKERGISNHAYQVALLNERVYDMLQEVKPDAVMYLGDTNTLLSAVTVARCGIPVIHLESGGRSFDWRMPEEKNRIVGDHLSDALYSYLERYKDLLIKEGVMESRVAVIGNIIVDAVEEYASEVGGSKILEELGVAEKKYILAGFHREENVTTKEILENKLRDLSRFGKENGLPVVFPLMPRTKFHIEKFGLQSLLDETILQTKPLGFFDFLRLEKGARLIVSDSGTVQEEALLVGTPCVIARRSTERPETIWAGATILEGQEAPGSLYEKMKEAFALDLNWDKTVLNPMGGSPSERAYKDLIQKIESGYFETSRNLDSLKDDPSVRQAYNI